MEATDNNNSPKSSLIVGGQRDELETAEFLPFGGQFDMPETMHTSSIPTRAFRVLSALCGLTIIVLLSTSGCAVVPSLDDATLETVEVATPEDLARLSDAMKQWERESFLSVSVRDPIHGRMEFTDYDAWQAYLGKNNELRPSFHASTDWPRIRISFSSNRMLFEPGENSGWANGEVYFCGRDDIQSDWKNREPILWRGRVIMGDVAREIGEALGVDREPQTYEFILRYTNWESTPSGLMLQPLSDDLCFSVVETPWATYRGRPLRIDMQTISEALGPLPRKP